MISKTSSVNGEVHEIMALTTETDSFPRISARDLFLVLKVFDQNPETTLENIRLRICVDRKKQRRGTFLWSAARDTTAELVRLGLIEGSCYAKNTQQYEAMKTNKLLVTADGRELSQILTSDRSGAYDRLLELLIANHPYLRRFIVALNRGTIFAPVISSMLDHVSKRYGMYIVLAEDVAKGEFDYENLLASLSDRLKRNLGRTEETEIREAVERLVIDSQPGAGVDDTTRFAKGFLNKLNDIVIPATLRRDGLGFDFRTHRTLWAMGQEFRVWAVIRSHPEFDGALIPLTSKISVNDNVLSNLTFDHGLTATRNGFLGKLYSSYQKLQALKQGTFVAAWELRAVFCLDNHCQPSVFNILFDESIGEPDGYRLDLEIQRQKPQHEEPLRAGKRKIGSIRVAKR